MVARRRELIERVDEQDRVVGVVDRAEAISRHWLHRIATVVCRDPEGRILVHRRADDMSRFPGQYHWLTGGAVDVGETYEQAAARELAEELGAVAAAPRFLFKYLCRGEISPYWLGLHETVLTDPAAITPDPAEISWYAWLTEGELQALARRRTFVSDGREALHRYLDK
ncbi:NUDIX hydrolase [Streptomyces spongiae]|uniref:NUDIX domain-containing protein n=1 Tax=Streptomyces spongiae TaxID=565072 RepID=A0A5N8XX62_9ACTN|nr:NUDIX domain-containing protein [Streptomyces spongiae]MPY63970.1 NUDIX domain-containing protein [Streptomyces spongiae]